MDVDFEVPRGFAVATRWRGTGERRYHVEDNRELADNCTVLGRFPVIELAEGPLQLTFALPGSTAVEEPLLEPLIRSALHAYQPMFPQASGRIFLAFFHGAEESLAWGSSRNPGIACSVAMDEHVRRAGRRWSRT